MPSFTGTSGRKSDIRTDRHNRYLIPRYPLDRPMRPDEEPIKGTGMEVPWTRVSTIIDTHEDKEGIFKWTKRLVVKGIGARPDLYALAAATRLEDKGTLLGIADQAFDYAKGQASSNLGTALHGFLERKLSGEELDVPEPWRSDVAAVAAAFQDAGIRLRPELQELVVVRPDLKDGDAEGVAGRFDLLVEREGMLEVTDYKTGSDPLAYGAWKIQQQLGVYGTGWAVWDGEFWRPMPPIRRDKILMVHVLPGQASVQIHQGDVDAETLEADFQAAYRTRRRRKEAKKAWRPLVTVEDGVVQADPAPAERVVASEPRQSGKTAQMEADEAKAQERLQAVAAAGNADVKAPAPDLAPLAGPGQRGCSVCGRTGHRKGSAKCLGINDPAVSTPEAAAGRTTTEVPADEVPPAHQGPHRDWTRNPMSGAWECGVNECGAPAAEPLQTELTEAQATQVELQDAELAPDDSITVDAKKLLSVAVGNRAIGKETVGDAAILSGDPDKVRECWTPDEEGGTEEELEAALAAAELARTTGFSMTRIEEESDPFADDDPSGADTRAAFLAELKAAPDKATLRDIRTRATAAGLWEGELVQAGMARAKEL
jgi:hypothetical protein